MDLEKRIQILEDIEKIKNVKHDFVKAIDTGCDWNKMEKVFTEDAIYIPGEGKYEGKQQIKEFFAAVSAVSENSLHNCILPKIVVNGDSAVGSWYVWCVSVQKEVPGIFLGGFYEEKYQKINGEWFIKESVFEPRFSTQY
jgi:bile-acid 7alpha-dehydratase